MQRLKAGEIKPASTGAAASMVDDKSVAVLAFANLSDDKGNEYFSDGISEELLNVLAKISGLKVTARTSSFHFKGKDTPIPEIAQQLGVAYVVEGSVRKQGDKVRITAQLIKAADGFHVWSDTFTRDLKDIFAVQDEIAGLIAQQLQLKLGESTRVTKVVNPEAYRLLLEGRQFWNLRSEDGFTKAEAAFTKALAIDPQFAEAHAGLAGVCVIRAVYRELDDLPLEANDLGRAVSEGRRALEIDPSSSDALAVLAYAQMLDDQLAESDRNFQRALALNPNSALVHCWYALLLSIRGRLDLALGHYQKAAEFDPLWFINLQMMGNALGFAHRPDQALGVLERAIALRTEIFLPNLAERARALLLLGRKEEAFAFARQVLHNPELQPRWGCDERAIEVLVAGGRRQEAEEAAAKLFTRYPSESYLRGVVLAALGRFDEALPFLQHTQSIIVRQIYWDSLWDPWREDPRFLQLMAHLGRAEEYQVARATLARMQAERAGK
jgi:TolB-like protein/Tfp pilus assembly protein PilF